METIIEEEQEIDELIENLLAEEKKLVLYNDPISTFDTVIYCLCEYTKYDEIRAEQTALIIHNSGKHIIKTGSFKKLEPIKCAFNDHQLTCEIE